MKSSSEKPSKIWGTYGKSKFIEIEPRMKNGEIDFERSDDDVVHVCQPLSFKKYIKKKGYEIIEFNKSSATTKFTKIFNSIFPNMASGNKFIVKKIFWLLNILL